MHFADQNARFTNPGCQSKNCHIKIRCSDDRHHIRGRSMESMTQAFGFKINYANQFRGALVYSNFKVAIGEKSVSAELLKCAFCKCIIWISKRIIWIILGAAETG